MAQHKKRGGNRVTINQYGCYLMVVQFESNNTSAPDGLDPSDGFTTSYSDVGDVNIIFDEDVKPREVLFADCQIAENDGDIFVKCGDYVASTGTLPLYLYTNSGGTISSADTTDKTYKLLMVCSDSKLSD